MDGVLDLLFALDNAHHRALTWMGGPITENFLRVGLLCWRVRFGAGAAGGGGQEGQTERRLRLASDRLPTWCARLDPA